MMKNFLTTLLFIFLHFSVCAQTWTQGGFRIENQEGKLKIFYDQKELVDIHSINFNFYAPVSASVVANTADTFTLQLNYPAAADWNHPDTIKTAVLDITQVDGGIRIHSTPGWGRHISIKMNDLGDHFYGLVERLYPDNQKSPDLRGSQVEVEIEGDGSLYGENYADAWSSFYISSLGYGSFMDTFAKGRYSFGINGQNEIYHDTGKLDWYIFYGPAGDAIHEAYFKIIGKPQFVPLWACGPIIWRDEHSGADQIVGDVVHFTDLEIPVTGEWVDRPYSNGYNEWSAMDFNENFKNPGEWITQLDEEYGVKFMTWIGPMIFADNAGDFPGLFPTYKGYFDLTDPEAVAEFGRRLHTYQYAVGVRGHKMDRADEDFPDEIPWHDHTPYPERKNKYVYLYNKIVDSLISKDFGKDQFIFARAAYQGSQQHLGAIWGGDVRNTWEGMAANLANAIRCGYMGFPVWGSDVGGYLGEGKIPEDLYARWLYWGAWSGMFEIKLDGSGGRGEDRPPWAYSEQLQNIFRQASALRMEMLPFLYSLANTSYKNGVLMKPLSLQYPDDEKTYQIWDEYMLGHAFLVAPVVTPGNKRTVYLPNGTWYDFHDLSKSYTGGETMEIEVPLESIPVYVRANSLYVTGQVLSGNSKNWIKNFDDHKSLTLHAFAGEDGDETHFDYVDAGANDEERAIQLRTASSQITLTADPLSLEGEIQLKCDEKPQSVRLNDKKAKFKFDEESGVLTLGFPKGTALHLVVDL